MKERVVAWWRRHHRGRPRIKRAVFYETRAELPKQIPQRELAIIGSYERPKWAIFECPCGRGHQLSVNLSPRQDPFWRLHLDKRGPSLWPSVDSFTPYGCHFWLRRGRVSWALEWIGSLN